MWRSLDGVDVYHLLWWKQAEVVEATRVGSIQPGTTGTSRYNTVQTKNLQYCRNPRILMEACRNFVTLKDIMY